MVGVGVKLVITARRRKKKRGCLLRKENSYVLSLPTHPQFVVLYIFTMCCKIIIYWFVSDMCFLPIDGKLPEGRVSWFTATKFHQQLAQSSTSAVLLVEWMVWHAYMCGASWRELYYNQEVKVPPLWYRCGNLRLRKGAIVQKAIDLINIASEFDPRSTVNSELTYSHIMPNILPCSHRIRFKVEWGVCVLL